MLELDSEGRKERRKEGRERGREEGRVGQRLVGSSSPSQGNAMV